MRWLPLLVAAACLVAFEPTSSFAASKSPPASAQKVKAKQAKHTALAKQTKRQHVKAKSAPGKANVNAKAPAKPKPAPAKK